MIYEKTEREILANSSYWAANPIRLFNLEGMGIDAKTFVNRFRPVFDRLPWDFYDKRRKRLELLRDSFPELKGQLAMHYNKYYLGQESESELEPLISRLSDDERAAFESILPERMRQTAFFRMARSESNGWDIKELEKSEYRQRVDSSDYRSLPRVYEPLAAEDANDPLLHEFLRGVAQMTREVCPDAYELELFIYFNTTVARPGIPGDNAPEGIHQDGADYIISALVVARDNIRGGQSVVYLGEATAEPILKTTLNPGQGIFQADGGSNLWHDVSKVFVKDERSVGVRCTIGVDIVVKSHASAKPR